MRSTSDHSYFPVGPFELRHQLEYFGDWATASDDARTVVMAFPVEGWGGSAAVGLMQEPDGRVIGKVSAPSSIAALAWEQALACFSLDVDATSWPSTGEHDKVIGSLQERYRFLRPVLFYSPYEAAASFIIGHRITIRQRKAIMARIASEIGERFDLGSTRLFSFPGPAALAELKELPGLSELKLERLRAVAKAALDGWLDRKRLRAMPPEEAVARLMTLSGVGPFFAQGILKRGAGLVDEITTDEFSRKVVQLAYKIPKPLDLEGISKIAERWRPFRMWSMVLLHIWARREGGLSPGAGNARARRK